MKTGMKHIIFASALLLASQAQGAGVATISTDPQAGRPAVTCMGSNGHPDDGSSTISGTQCAVKGQKLQRGTPRYSSVS